MNGFTRRLAMAFLFVAPLSAAAAPCPEPAVLPPADSVPLYRCAEFVFHPENYSLVDGPTYQRYLQTLWSQPSQGKWVPYDEAALQRDFWSLWHTGFLNDLWIEAIDEPYANGVPGKHIVFHLEERARIKTVDYAGSTRVAVSDIDKAMREAELHIQLNAFVDETTIRKAAHLLRAMYADQGYHAAAVTHALTSVGETGRLVQLTFTIDEGPRYQLDEIVFDGNTDVSDRELRAQMKDNRPRTWLSWLRRNGRLRLALFADDADRLLDHYGNLGYVKARVGAEQIEVLRDSDDGRTRHVRLRVPIEEGQRYYVGTIDVTGSTIVDPATFRRLIRLHTGDLYDRRRLDDAIARARELYGALGHLEFLPSPEFTFHDTDAPPHGSPATVDITLRVTEGPRYRVNRLTFQGNATTRDHVIRREMRVVDGSVFNSEALKESVRRLNQLGYFEPVDPDKALSVSKTPGTPDAVDVTVTLKEQNRNQFNFGAGLSQYDGAFGSLSFATSNLMGRGESLSVAFQRGQRARSNQLAFTEPYLFDRPITAGAELFSRKNDYVIGGSVGYSEVRSGATGLAGLYVLNNTRLYTSYSYERIETAVRNDLLGTTIAAAGAVANLYLEEGRQIESRVSPSVVYNTVNHPVFPTRGVKMTGTLDLAGTRVLGGTTDYIKTDAELIFYRPQTSRLSFGVRGQAGWIRPFGQTTTLPYYRRFYLGGEYQIRGVEVRSVGPLDDADRLIGGTRYVLFNAEYYVDLFKQVRLVAFHDAGQAFAEDEPLTLRRLRTSSGAEFRMMMPVINLPVRLIYSLNLYRDGFQPARTMKFATGVTF